MKTITFYVMALLCLITAKLNAQQTFQERANAIADNIAKISRQEKDSLKAEVERVNNLLDKKAISAEEAEMQKKQYAETRAKNIETRIAAEEEKLSTLVKDKAKGKIEGNKSRRFSFTYDNTATTDDSTQTPKEYVYNRTTSQFVFALGANRVMHDGKIDNDNFKARSDFYEWGVTLNTRLLKNNNLLHLKYGLSLQYNNLRPENNRIFVKQGDKTVLQDTDMNLKVSRFRYVNLVIPAHLEFDFTKKRVNGDKTYYPSHNSFRVGLGGYAGINVKEKQITKFNDENDNYTKNRTRGDYNVNDFTYGVSAYVGYGEFSLYAKYDLNPVFENNDIDQNNLSLGIRFDFN